MGSKRKRTNTNQQQDLLSAYERPKKAKGVRVKGGDPSGEEKIRLSDIDVNEQKYILSMIKVREREQTKRKLKELRVRMFTEKVIFYFQIRLNHDFRTKKSSVSSRTK